MRRQAQRVLALGAAALCASACAGIEPGAALLALAPGHRPLEARPSFPLEWAPPAPESLAPAPLPDRERAYAALLRARVEGRPGADRALALFYAARGEEGDEARALALLGLPRTPGPSSDAPDPGDAGAAIDRGAVLLALGRFDEAYERFAAAVEADPASAVARFDAALALQALALDGQAAAAFEAALALEPAGPWADEARDRLDALRAPRPPAVPVDLRKSEAFEQLLVAGPDDVESFRPLAEELGAVGDELFARALDYLELLDLAGWERRAEEVERYRRGVEAIYAGQVPSPEFAALLDSPDPQLSVRAAQFAAYGEIRRGDRPAARRYLARIRERCASLGCREEAVLAASDEGTLLHVEGDLRGALRAFDEAERALPAGLGLRRAELVMKRATAARDVGALGDAALGLDTAYRLFRAFGVQRTVNPLQLRADVLGYLGLHRAEEATRREAVLAAAGRPELELRATLALADAIGRNDRRVPEAIDVLEGIRERLEASRLDGLQAGLSRTMAELLLREGEVARALEEAQAGVDRARDRRSVVSRAGGLGVLAAAARAAGDHRRAIEALEEAVALDDLQVANAPTALGAARLRASLVEHRQWLALLRAEGGDAAGAVRALAGAPLSVASPSECRMVHGYLDQLWLVGVATDGGPRFDVRPVPREALARALGDADLAALGRLLGSPWDPGRCPASTDRLAIVEPTGGAALPVASLARWLRPDAWVGVAIRPDAAWPGPRPGGVPLVVFDPATSGDEAPPLPAGAVEATAIQELLGGRQLSGAAATPAALRAAAPAADFLHLAVHGIAVAGSGAASYLRLAGDEGRFQVADALRLDLAARRPVVVLSACRTAGVPGDREHDGAGLPWAFLAAGASAVVAHEGPLDDRAGPTFAREFYRHIAAGGPVPAAVSSAAAAVEPELGREAAARFVLYFGGGGG